MKVIRIIGAFIFLGFQFTTVAQQLSFKNFKVAKNPYLQFNNIVSYKNKLFFTSNEGVYTFTNNKLTVLIKQQNLARFVKTNQALYVWSIYGKIFKINNRQLIPMPFNKLLAKKLYSRIINSVIFTNNCFYISTVIGNELLKIDLTKQTIVNLTDFKNHPYYVSKIGNKYISGTNQFVLNKNLYINIGKSPYSITLADNINSSKTNILPLKDSSFIFTKQHEVIRFNKSKIINRIFTEKNIETVFQDNEGKIWFALNSGGVSCYTNAELKSSTVVRYLGNKTIISITQDNKGNIWFGSSGHGVYELEKSKLANYSTPRIFSSTNTKNESITSSHIIKNVPVLGSNSNNILRTDTIIIDTIPPIVFINKVKINGKDTASLNYYKLSHYQNNIEINISGFINNQSELQFKYILEGKEVNWNYSVDRKVYYSSLVPGNYTFKVFAMSDNGLWSKLPAVISFNISTPIWTSIWFITSVLLLLIAIILIITFIINKKTQFKNKIIEEGKRKVLISELQALRSQMNPHFIFNTLSSIQNFITKNESKEAITYLSKFAKLMRATLENTKKQTISIKDEIETLDLYLQLEKLRLNNKFTYRFEVDKNIDTQFDKIPSMLIQPYVENAIWHGISPQQTVGKITITFTLENENLIKCIVEDNGIGRKKSMEIKQKKNTKNSFGMSITKERLEILNSLKNSHLSIKIIDLMENNIAKGTRIELFIPLN